jgi:hypothetical protein
VATKFAPDSPARLFRSTAPGPAEMSQRSLEQVGDGGFDKMVRIALSDPDDEIWRYAIGVSGETLKGEAIRQFCISADKPGLSGRPSSPSVEP